VARPRWTLGLTGRLGRRSCDGRRAIQAWAPNNDSFNFPGCAADDCCRARGVDDCAGADRLGANSAAGQAQPPNEGTDPMKRTLLFVALLSIASVGCQHRHQMTANSCSSCGSARRGMATGLHANRAADRVPAIPPHFHQQPPPAGPAMGNVGYPYYTTRAPRDFLSSNPGSIGP
jgi:hypothetical protein